MSPALAHALVWFPIAAVIAVLMDFWSALLHGKVWHTWLWPVHRSHHEPRTGTFELNDAFALLHAPVAMALILWGCAGPAIVWREVAFGVGIGMTVFAVGYGVVHDGLVHGRLPVKFLLRSRAIRKIVRAHEIHHKGVTGGAPYGLFFGPWELARAAAKKKRVTRASHGAPSDPSARRA